MISRTDPYWRKDIKRSEIEGCLRKHGWSQIADNFWMGRDKHNEGILARVEDHWVIFYLELELVIHTWHRDYLKDDFRKDIQEILDI